MTTNSSTNDTTPACAYDSVSQAGNPSGRYLVVFARQGQILGSIVTATNGTNVLEGPQVLSHPADFAATTPDVAYNSSDDEW